MLPFTLRPKYKYRGDRWSSGRHITIWVNDRNHHINNRAVAAGRSVGQGRRVQNRPASWLRQLDLPRRLLGHGWLYNMSLLSAAHKTQQVEFCTKFSSRSCFSCRFHWIKMTKTKKTPTNQSQKRSLGCSMNVWSRFLLILDGWLAGPTVTGGLKVAHSPRCPYGPLGSQPKPRDS